MTVKKLFLIVPIFSVVLLSGCSNDNQSNGEQSAGIAGLPESLTVDADLPENVPENASIYKVVFKNFDRDELLEYFDMESYSHYERDAIGHYYIAGNKYLTVYDEEGVLYGGFSYDNAVSGDVNGINFASEDVDFAKNHVVNDFSETEVLTFLEDVGLDELVVDSGYGFSGEELNAYMQSSEEFADGEDVDFEPESTYLSVSLLQEIDDIPLITVPWGISGVEHSTYTRAKVIYCDHQCIWTVFENLYDVEREISSGETISPEEALDIFIDDYNKSLELNTTKITDISFNYVVTMDSDGMYALPAYYFAYEYGEASEDSSEAAMVEETKVISAITGEFILSMESGL